jgi:tetratricopeptide (TPR) repeat protein
MLRTVSLRITALLLVCFPDTALAEWSKLQTPHFLFVGDASEGQIRRTAQRLEQFRDVLGRALPANATSSPVPTVVIVFGSARSFAPYRPRFEGRAIEAAGFFQSGEDANFIVVNGSTGEQALTTILHEYAHAVVSNRMGSLPAWLNEGLAEFYETFESRNGGRSALIGLAPAHHVQLLRGTTLIPLRDLFAITTSSSDYNEGRRRGVFYAQSWALWHYLYFSGEPRASQLNRYVLEAPTAPSQEAAVRAAFGDDLQSLEGELRRYVSQVSFKAITFAFDEKVLGRQVGPILRIDEPEATAFLGDLLGRVRREDEARSMLLPLLQEPRGGARASAALGLLELRQGRTAEALALLEPAAARYPQDLAVQGALARALIARLSEVSGNSEARQSTLDTAKGALTRVLAGEPDNAYATAMLGFVELSLGADVARAESLLARAAAMAPARQEYRIMHARALARQGDYQRATSILGPLVGFGSSQQTRDAARAALGTIAQMRNAAAPTTTGQRSPQTTSAPSADLAALATLPSQPAALPSSQPAEEPIRAASLSGPSLRAPGPGETRLLGVLQAIECRPGLVVAILATTAGSARLGAKRFEDIDFITYRTDSPGTVECGPLPSPARVLATYRPSETATSNDSTLGDLVAVELLPDDYTPRPTPGEGGAIQR